MSLGPVNTKKNSIFLFKKESEKNQCRRSLDIKFCLKCNENSLSKEIDFEPAFKSPCLKKKSLQDKQ